MKARVTLTISPQVSMKAKTYARRRGISVSALVEQLLVEVADPAAEDPGVARGGKSFSARWEGRGHLSRKDDARTRRLKEKYNL